MSGQEGGVGGTPGIFSDAIVYGTVTVGIRQYASVKTDKTSGSQSEP